MPVNGKVTHGQGKGCVPTHKKYQCWFPGCRKKVKTISGMKNHVTKVHGRVFTRAEELTKDP